MKRRYLVPVAVCTMTLVLTASAFHWPSVSVARTGTVLSATPMLEARSGHTGTLLPNGKVLIAGGMRRNQDFYRSAELYDPSTGKFVYTGDMNMGRVSHAAVLLNSGKVLIAGDGWQIQSCSTPEYSPFQTAGRGGPVAIWKTAARRWRERCRCL